MKNFIDSFICYFNKQNRLQEPLFLFTGNCFDNIISDVTYEATSTDPGHSPSDAVLDNDRAWCTSQPPPNEYLEVYLGHLYDVCGIVIQGFKNDSVDFFTTNYSLSFSKRRPAWSFLLDNDKSPKVNKSIFYILTMERFRVVQHQISHESLVFSRCTRVCQHQENTSDK